MTHAEQMCRHTDVYQQAQHYLHHAQRQRYGEEILLEVEEMESGEHRHLRYRESEERVRIESEQHRGTAADDRKPCRTVKACAALLQKQQTCQQKDKSVTGIVETDGEEQHVERREEGRQIQRAVLGQRIERPDKLEHPRETVVLQFDRRIVLRRGILLDIYHVGILLQKGVHTRRGLLLGPSLHDDERAVSSLRGRAAYLHILHAHRHLVQLGTYGIHTGRTTRVYLVQIGDRSLSLGRFCTCRAVIHRRSLYLLSVDRHLLVGRRRHDKIYG